MQNEMRPALRALKGSEYGCPPDAFLSQANLVLSPVDSGTFFKMVGFGRGTVVAADPALVTEVSPIFAREDGIFCFDAPQLCGLNAVLRSYGYQLDEIYDTYLPTEIPHTAFDAPAGVEIAKLDRSAMSGLEWSAAIENAVSAPDGENKDEFAYAATVQGTVVSIAGVSSNYPRLWSVGVDTLPEYRGRGLATYLISLLSRDVLALGKIPIYSTWYSNIGSRSTCLRCGYRPGCVEIHATRQSSMPDPDAALSS